MEREYFLLGDAASRAGCSANDLIHFGATGNLVLCALMVGNPATEHDWDSDPEENEFACEQYAEDGPPKGRLYGPMQLPKYTIRQLEAGADDLIHYVYEPSSRKDSKQFFPIIWNLDTPVPISDFRLVVLAEDLKKLSEVPTNETQQNHVSKSSLQKPLGERERITLLVIISALAKEAKIDILKPSKAAELIDRLTQTLGARVAARTIEDHLKRIPAALENRANTGT